MGQIYGNRWRGIDGNLGQGGQGHVLRVIDLQDVSAGPYALKRVTNPRRADRFRSEVEAIKSLSHPNIIPLIDHSALDESSEGLPAKQYIVMPVAEGGNLGENVARFAGKLDPVLDVSIEIAEALKAAHDKRIIHRDVKPENVLLKSPTENSIWVTDFGICLIDDGRSRNTQEGEVVGPVVFMAPELEGGGNLSVTPAADIYSLGKLIFFLFTGGLRLPRENLGEEPYASSLAAPGLEGLRLLLTQMICPLSQRLQTMDIVLTRLKQLRSPVSTTGLTDAGRTAMKQATSRMTEEERQRTARKAEEQRTSTMLQAAAAAWSTWIEQQAKAGADELNTPGAFNSWNVKSEQGGGILNLGSYRGRVIAIHDVLYQTATPPNSRIWALRIHLYETRGRQGTQLGIIMKLELREPDGRLVGNCSAWLRQEKVSRNTCTHEVTGLRPTVLQVEVIRAADAEEEIRTMVRNAVSALPELASRETHQFIIMQMSEKPRRR